MLFSSSIFIFAFLPIALLIYRCLPAKFRNGFLLLASFFFYAWGEPKFILILFTSIFCNYVLALLMERKHGPARKVVLMLVCVFNIGLLFVFKYTNFMLENLSLLTGLSFSIVSISLPIGISFFTFQALSYVIDVYRGEVKAQHNPLDLALYISLFPQLVAGPIVRYQTIAFELKQRSLTWDNFHYGVQRFIIGLSKKMIIANNLAGAADYSFDTVAKMETISVSMAWLGAICYTFQIYYDFSGYSDMAIGLGRMFGFHFEENFNYPYISKSITEFWRRWHISLSTWFRDYVYIPLGGSRVGKWHNICNLFVVWALTGIWHGAAWNFLLWGLFYFALLVIEKQWIHPEKRTGICSSITYRIVTLLVIIIAWVLFRSNGLANTISYIGYMLGLQDTHFWNSTTGFYLKDNIIYLVLATIFSIPVFPMLEKRLTKKQDTVFFQVGKTIIYVGLFIITLSYILLGAHNPFIYFNF